MELWDRHSKTTQDSLDQKGVWKAHRSQSIANLKSSWHNCWSHHSQLGPKLPFLVVKEESTYSLQQHQINKLVWEIPGNSVNFFDDKPRGGIWGAWDFANLANGHRFCLLRDSMPLLWHPVWCSLGNTNHILQKLDFLLSRTCLFCFVVFFFNLMEEKIRDK